MHVSTSDGYGDTSVDLDEAERPLIWRVVEARPQMLCKEARDKNKLRPICL